MVDVITLLMMAEDLFGKLTVLAAALLLDSIMDDSWVLVGEIAWKGQPWLKFSDELNDDEKIKTLHEDGMDVKLEEKNDWDGKEWNKYCGGICK